MRHLVAGLVSAAALGIFGASLTGIGAAQSGPPRPGVATPSPSPAPTKAPPRLTFQLESYTSAINQQMVGPGISPPEAPGFIAGSLVAPGTPYDLLNKGPLVTGMGIHQELKIAPTFAMSPLFDLSVSAGYGSAGGSGNVDTYWGDAMMPSLNPSMGFRAFSVPPAFPTHNGADGIQATRVSILQGSIALHSGDGAFTMGWLTQHQTARFVFNQPAWTNTPAQLVPLLPSNIGEGSPGSDIAASKAPILDLQGFDAWYRQGLATAELTNAVLPSLPGSPARMMSASLAVAHGQRLVYSGEIVSLTQSGPITAPVLFGNLPFTSPSAYGPIAQSTLFGQRMVVAGAGAVFPVGDSDAEARVGYSCYGASGAFAPQSSCVSGTYLYGKFHHGFNAFDAGLELVYFSPRYAPAILPYGTPQNIWQIAWAWPRTWYPGYFQFVDHSIVGANRQGARLTAGTLIAGVEIRLAGSIFQQVSNYDNSTAFQPGFVEPYFTPQLTAAGGTRGWEHHLDAALSWKGGKVGDVRLDLTDTTINRAPSAPNPTETVKMDYPGAILAYTRAINERTTGSVGAGWYGAFGSFNGIGPANANLSENVVFAGFEYKANPTSVYHVQYRLYSMNGSPTIPGGPLPLFHGPQIIFEQLFKT
jgi:hypothetical protein